MALADQADDLGQCRVGTRRLAAICCMSRRGVQKVIHQLEAAGLILAERRRDRKSVQYRLLFNHLLRGKQREFDLVDRRTGFAYQTMRDRRTGFASCPEIGERGSPLPLNDQRSIKRSIGKRAGNPSHASAEKEWLLKLRQGFERFNLDQADIEMANNGGKWRLRFRQDPDKCERVLAEIVSMVKEKRMRSNAGACADDLWRRFA